ncbi:MAG: HigA family addiction module antitoxin [Baekduia sp.]
MSGRDWTVAPGDTLAEWMEEVGISERVLAKACSIDRHTLSGILKGQVSINAEMAGRLHRATGISARFWITFEKQYRADLEAGHKRS